MESPATIKGNIGDMLQNPTTANIAHLVETYGKANSNTYPLSD